MSEFAWESVAATETQTAPVEQSEQQPEKNLALSADDFAALEERILRAVELVKRERHARTEAEERATMAEALFSEQVPQIENLQKEVNSLRAERDHVRERVERLLAQLDALEV
jgi:FtsZ-binding cell division protein ZapB